MAKLDSILKSRDITLSTKGPLVKAVVFPVIMYGCESWTVKKAECWRIDAFELWCWRRLLRVPWTARRSSQSILKIRPGCSLVGLILKLKLQYSGHLMRRADSRKRPWFWEGLGAGGEGDDRGRDGWMASLTRWRWVWVNSGSWWWIGRPGVLWFVGSQRVGHDWVTELNWCQYHMSVLGFLHSSVSKSSACNAGDPDLIPGLGRSPGEGNSNPLQDSCLENPMDRGVWQATVHGGRKSWTQLSD